MGISIARASDVLQGYLKFTLMVLIICSSVMFLWVLLLTTQAIPFHKTCLYVAVLLGVSFSWSTQALFFELAAEIAYPVPEGIVGGYIAALANISSAVFFFVYFIPGIGIMWMNYCLLLYSLGSIVAMAMVEEQYNRMAVE
ncbi:Disrupted in renal carcinoma protein 2 [Blattella germanica]|nr:Disrupted in renal carcinoma protein 2 [Blattella germanica]